MSPRLAAPPFSEATLQRLVQGVYDASGIRLAERQRPLLEARVRARMVDLDLDSEAAYDQLLRAGGDRGGEMDRLLDLLAIHESYFFREISQLLLAVRRLVPAALRARPAEPVRIWSAGCASGEEPYSLVILLDEGGVWREGAFDILGTDLSPSCLERARRGIYSAAALRDTTPARRGRYFERSSGEWRLRDELRRRVRLRRLNLYRESDLGVVGRFDLILCRNVLLYMDAPARARVVATLHDRLRAGGWLLVGRSETLLNVPSPLEAVELDGEVAYRRAGGAGA